MRHLRRLILNGNVDQSSGGESCPYTIIARFHRTNALNYVSVPQVYALVRSGELPAIKIGGARTVLTRVS